jgi:hypothetical protein
MQQGPRQLQQQLLLQRMEARVRQQLLLLVIGLLRRAMRLLEMARG